MPKLRILMDSCIIIEAFRTKCWTAITRHFDVETVEECVSECCTGDPLAPGRVPIDREALLRGIAKVHAVSEREVATLSLEVENLPEMDAGEKHMMAWLYSHPTEAVIVAISTTDQAAVRATHVLGLIGQVRSLQDVAHTSGVGKAQIKTLEHHFTDEWLARLRARVSMGVL